MPISILTVKRLIAEASRTGSSATSSFAATASYALTAQTLLGSVESASYASNAATANTAQTASYVVGYVANSSTGSMLLPYVLTIATSSMSVASSSFATSASWAPIQTTASYALTASYAPNYVANSSTSSMLSPYLTTASTASMLTPYLLSSSTGSLTVASSSYAQTASYAPNYVLNSVTSSMLGQYVLTSSTSSMSVLSSSFAVSSSYSTNAASANTSISASYSTNAGTSISSSFASSTLSASYALTASYTPNYVLNSVTSSMLTPYVLTSATSSMTVLSSSFAISSSRSISSSYASNATNANSSISASFASSALSSSWAPIQVSSSYASTASYVLQAVSASYAPFNGGYWSVSASNLVNNTTSSVQVQLQSTKQFQLLNSVGTIVGYVDELGIGRFGPGSTYTAFGPASANIHLSMVRSQASADFTIGNPQISQPYTMGSTNNFGTSYLAGSTEASGSAVAEHSFNIGNGFGDGITSGIFRISRTRLQSTVPLKYATNLTASYDIRTLVDKGYVDNITSSLNVGSASYAQTASYAAGYVLNSATSSMLLPYVLTSVTSSMTVLSSSFAVSSSRSITASFASSALSASYASTASYVVQAQTASFAQGYVLTSSTSSMSVLSSSFATTASYALTAQTLIGSVVSASYALTASYALNGGSGGGVSGTGSIGTLAVFTGASSIGDSNITDDGSVTTLAYNGTAAIDTRLNIINQGNGGAGRGTAILIGVPGSANSVNGAKLNFYTTGGATVSQSVEFAIQTATSGSLTEKIRILANGNVGIATSASNSNLSIGSTNANYRIDLAGERGYFGYNTSYGATGAVYVDGGASNNKPIIINPVSTGNVGFNTTTPIGRVNIFTGLTGIGDFNITSQQSGSISFANIASTSAVPAMIGKSNNNTGLYLISATNDTNAAPDFELSVRENNNTDYTTLTTPAFRFSRFGTILAEILRNGNTTINGAAGADVLYLQKSTGASLGLSGATGTVNSVILNASNTTNPSLDIYAGGSVRMSVSSSGYVGIGTTSPTNLLTLKNVGELGLDFSDNDLQKYRIFTRASDSTLGLYDLTNLRTFFRHIGNATVSSSSLSLMETGGRVGIGTTSPGVRFTNSGAALAITPILGSGSIGADAILSANGLYGLYTGVANNGDVWQQVQRNDLSTVTYNLLLNPLGGRVGVGTLAPTALLDVDGDTKVTGSLGVTGASTFASTVTATNFLSPIAQHNPNGSANDPYGAVAVTNPTTSNYSYYGLTRAGQIGAGIGITTGNLMWFGGATSGGATSVLSGTAYLTLSAGTSTFSGRVVAPSFTGSLSGTATNATTASYALTSAGGVSLTGATNFIPKITGVDTLGQSLLYDSGSTMVIVSATDSVPLTVRSTLAGNVSSIGFQGLASTNGFNVRLGANDEDMVFYTANTERMRVSGSGQVGIGTTAPIGKLTVREATTSWELNTSATGVQQLSYDRTGAAYKKMEFRGSFFTFNPSDVEEVRIDASGNVGIGVNNPSASLHVSGNLTYNVPSTGSTAGEIVYFGTGTLLTPGSLYYLNTATPPVWTACNASAASTSTGMLAIALGTSVANGMLVRGMARFGSTQYTNATNGQILYASTTSGSFSGTAPSLSNQIVRVVGYCVAAGTTVYFAPDNTWITLA